MEWFELPELPLVVEADADTLLARLGRLLQVGDLLEIAGCDHGWRAAEHIDGLSRILEEGMPRPLGIVPAEVLMLTRWSEPDAGLDPYAFDAAHRRRAFACAALLRSLGNESDDEPDGNGMVMGPNTTLIQLIASLRVLGEDHDAAAAAFLQWLIPRLPAGEEDDAAFLGLGLLWFVLPPESGVSDPRLAALADWIMAAEHAVASFWRFGADAMRPWLLATTHFDSCHDVWRAFAGWLEDRAPARPALRETIILMAAAMREAPSES